MTPRQPRQQTIQDIQTDFAAEQTAMKDDTVRQTQTKTAYAESQWIRTEGISQDEVARPAAGRCRTVCKLLNGYPIAGAIEFDQIVL